MLKKRKGGRARCAPFRKAERRARLCVIIFFFLYICPTNRALISDGILRITHFIVFYSWTLELVYLLYVLFLSCVFLVPADFRNIIYFTLKISRGLRNRTDRVLFRKRRKGPLPNLIATSPNRWRNMATTPYISLVKFQPYCYSIEINEIGKHACGQREEIEPSKDARCWEISVWRASNFTIFLYSVNKYKWNWYMVRFWTVEFVIDMP